MGKVEGSLSVVEEIINDLNQMSEKVKVGEEINPQTAGNM